MKTEKEVQEALHEELHEGKPCRVGVTCRRLATARHLAPTLHRLMAAERAELLSEKSQETA